jgi:hypothetical protein
VEDVPAVGLEAGRRRPPTSRADGAGEADLVGVVEVDQLAEAEVAGEAGGLGGDPSWMSPSVTMP